MQQSLIETLLVRLFVNRDNCLVLINVCTNVTQVQTQCFIAICRESKQHQFTAADCSKLLFHVFGGDNNPLHITQIELIDCWDDRGRLVELDGLDDYTLDWFNGWEFSDCVWGLGASANCQK